MSKDFKPLTVDDFDLSPKEMKILVSGAQKFFPPDETEAEQQPANEPAKPEDLHARKS